MIDREPLDPNLRALLKRSESHSDMPEGAPAEIFARVSASVALGEALGGTLAADAARHGSAPVSRVTSRAVASEMWSTARKATTWIAFAAGVATGSAGYATYQNRMLSVPGASVSLSAAPRRDERSAPPPPSVATIGAPVGPELNGPAPSSSAVAPPPVTAATLLPGPTSPHAAVAQTDDDHELARARAELEVARTALGRGRFAAAFATLDADARKHPRSPLAEERESLTIQALALDGRSDEARRRADAFRARFPNSLFLPAITTSLELETGNTP